MTRGQPKRGNALLILAVSILLIYITAPDLRRRAHVYFFGQPVGMGTVRETQKSSKGGKTIEITLDDQQLSEPTFLGPTYLAGSRLKISAAGSDLAWTHPAPLIQSAGFLLISIALFFLAVPLTVMGRTWNKELPAEAAIHKTVVVALAVGLLMAFGAILAFPR